MSFSFGSRKFLRTAIVMELPALSLHAEISIFTLLHFSFEVTHFATMCILCNLNLFFHENNEDSYMNLTDLVERRGL